MTEKSTSNSRRVLIVEDSLVFRQSITDDLTESGFDAVSVENGKAALELYRKEKFPVVITDLEMPVMGGKELIGHLNNFELVPTIVVITSHYEPEVIIDIMKYGVYDYIIKPPNKKELILKIARAFDIFEMNRQKIISEKEKVIRLEKQLEWYKRLERIDKTGTENADKQFFENMTRSFSQGAGFGSLLTLLDIVKSSAVEDGNNYVISKEIFDHVTENHSIAGRAMNRFAEIDDILKNKPKFQTISCLELYEKIEEIIAGLKSMQDIDDHTIILSEKKELFDKIMVSGNSGHLNDMISELLINALKFSEPETTINVNLEIIDSSLILSVTNHAKSFIKDEQGIPTGYENIIFEPFIRLSKEVHHKYETLDFGLGLPLVEKIIQRHQGEISLYNFSTPADKDGESEVHVNCRISLPIQSVK